MANAELTGFDPKDPRNRLALVREYQRRRLTEGDKAARAAEEQSRDALLRQTARYVDLRPDPMCPVVFRLQAMLDQALEVPEGKTRDAKIAAVFRESVLARHWEMSTKLLAPGWVSSDFSDAQREMWEWFRTMGDERPRPLVACIFRGGSKSSTVQLMLAHIAMARIRNYGIYVGASQPSTRDKVSAVGELLTQPIVRRAFSSVSEVYEAASGQKRDWRRDRIRTKSGFALDALGMDQAIRGIKLDEQRPDVIIADDWETREDTPSITEKKIDIWTSTIIPSGASNAATLLIQNQIHAESMMTRLVNGRADYLTDRRVIGPVPQIEGFAYEDRGPNPADGGRRFKITAGRPTWVGKNLDVSEMELNDLGPAAFKREKQHDMSADDGDKFPRAMWKYVNLAPNGLILCRAWDLAATEGGGDFTVGVLFGIERINRLSCYILDVRRGQWGDAKVEQNVRAASEEDRMRYGSVPVVIEQQPGGAGKVWSNRWKRDVLPGFQTKLVAPQGSKVWRADGYAGRQQDGQVHLVLADWNAAFVAEHAQFPDNCDHDDQVDAAALAYNFLTGHRKRALRATSAARRSFT